MPIYDMQCPACKEIKEIVCKIADMEKQRCGKCKCKMQVKILAGNYKSASFPFKSGWYEHIAADPIYIGSKRQLKTETEKRGLTSIYAIDG